MPVVDAHSLSPRFPEGYCIHPDFHAKYEVVAELGAGGQGFVLQAQRRTDGQQVAVKLSRKPDHFSDRWSEHPTYGFVNNDVLTMDVARHENIIALLDVYSDDTYLYIVSYLRHFACRSWRFSYTSTTGAGALWHPLVHWHKEGA